MKSSIKLIAFIALFFSFSLVASAQRGERSSDPTERAEKEVSKLTEELKLDEAQAAKIKEISLTYATKMKEARDANKENRDAMKELRSSMEAEKSAEMKTVLTEEQFAAYTKLVAERGGRGKKGRGGKKGRPDNK